MTARTSIIEGFDYPYVSAAKKAQTKLYYGLSAARNKNLRASRHRPSRNPRKDFENPGFSRGFWWGLEWPTAPLSKPSIVKAGIAASLLIIVASSFLFPQNSSVEAVVGVVPGNLTVSGFISLGLSSDLSTSVTFGSLDPNTQDNNATSNGGVNSTYYLYSIDSGTAVDFCMKANAQLATSDGVTIGNGNYTFNSSFEPGGPALPGVAINTSYQKLAQQGVGNNVYDYLRFWLDVPVGQPAGAYNNTLTFKVVSAGAEC